VSASSGSGDPPGSPAGPVQMGDRVVATAPVRVADVGGWTDTWFGSPGQVCSLAVGPGVMVEASVVAAAPQGGVLPVRIEAPALGEEYWCGPSPDRGWRRPIPGRHPLIEHAVATVLEDACLPHDATVEVRISSQVPAGASLGTSASVVVTVLAALDALLARPRSASDLAAAAHEVETTRAGRESGVADQWAAAFGGCALLAISPYPTVRRRAIELDPSVETALAERLVTVAFGPHDSSAVHSEVIDAMVGCGGPAHDRARASLGRLAALAGDAAAALRVGDVDRWAEVLVESTEAQARLHPGLVGPTHRAAVDAASAAGAVGWKVNGAGGGGGSLTAVSRPGGAASLRAALTGAVPNSQVLVLRPVGGLDVRTATGR